MTRVEDPQGGSSPPTPSYTRVRKVYFIGAQCTGKTTLAEHVRDEHNIRMVSEVVRELVEDREDDLSEIRADITDVSVLQGEIARQQYLAEQGEVPYVSDRAFDFLAYTAMYANNLNRLRFQKIVEDYISHVADSSIIFFCRPQEQFIEDDGFRKNLSWENVNQIDGMIKLLCELFDMNYISIDTPYTNERIRTVDAVLESIEWSD